MINFNIYGECEGEQTSMLCLRHDVCACIIVQVLDMLVVVKKELERLNFLKYPVVYVQAALGLKQAELKALATKLGAQVAESEGAKAVDVGSPASPTDSLCHPFYEGNPEVNSQTHDLSCAPLVP